jgi:hypothetical protein
MIEAGILGAIGIAERIAGFELATLTSGNVRFDANIDTTRISVRIRRQSLTYSAWQFASLDRLLDAHPQARRLARLVSHPCPSSRRISRATRQ